MEMEVEVWVWMEVEDGLILINIFYSSRIATRAHPSASTMPIPMPMFEWR